MLFKKLLSRPRLEAGAQKPSWVVYANKWPASLTAIDSALAIADQTPLVTDRVVVVGEVWLSNRAQLLVDLSLEGASDLELAARLWERYGLDAPLRMNGMFAFYVYDRRDRRGYLVRDRAGSRTLYYSAQGVAGARLRNVAAASGCREVDSVALRDYLCCAFVPGERTLLKGVLEVRPGTIVEFPGGRKHTYWAIEERLIKNRSLEWHGLRLRELLEQVISEYLPNDDVGVYLSGGLDSSCVTALARRLHARDVHTYSIHFGSETPNELEFSTLVADHCKTRHTIIEITPEQMWGLLPETMGLLDDPIGDPLTVPNLILGREAKRSVNVILNGEGGDPCFGGPKNQPMLLRQLYGGERRQIEDYLASFQKCSADLERLLKPDVYREATRQGYVFEADLKARASYLNQLMFINTKYKGADHILTKVNNLTSALGISGRSPLFDQRVVEMSLEIPPDFKLKGAQEKAVLKAAVADLLPQTILERPKSGMMVPVQLGFRKYWQRQARDLLLGRRARIADYLQQGVIKEWLDYQGDTWSRYGVKLWLLASLEYWLQANLDSSKTFI